MMRMQKLADINDRLSQIDDGLEKLSTGYISGQGKVDQLLIEYEKLAAPESEKLSIIWRKAINRKALEICLTEYEEQSGIVTDLLKDVVESFYRCRRDSGIGSETRLQVSYLF